MQISHPRPNWWDMEQPQVVETPCNVVRYYPNAGKLQLSRGVFNGRPGKTVTLDLSTVRRGGQGPALRDLMLTVAKELE